MYKFTNTKPNITTNLTDIPYQICLNYNSKIFGVRPFHTFLVFDTYYDFMSNSATSHNTIDLAIGGCSGGGWWSFSDINGNMVVDKYRCYKDGKEFKSDEITKTGYIGNSYSTSGTIIKEDGVPIRVCSQQYCLVCACRYNIKYDES